MSAAAMAAVMAAAASARAEQQLKNAAAAAASADALLTQKRLKNAAESVTGASASQEAAAAVVAAQITKLHLERAAENAALKRIKNAQAAAAVAAAAAAAATVANNLQPITLRPETPSDEAHGVVLLFCNGGGWEAVKNLSLISAKAIFVRRLLQNVKEIQNLLYQTEAQLEIINEKYNKNTNVHIMPQLATNFEKKTAVKALINQVISWLHLCEAKKQNKQQLKSLFAGIKKVSPDGWCFYHSIITGLEHSSNIEKAIKLSHDVVRWLRNNRNSRLSNGYTIEELYNKAIGKSIIPIHNSRYTPSRTLSMDGYLFLSGQETDTMAPVVWPEVAIVGYAIANLKNVHLIIYSDRTGEPTATYAPFQTPTKVVSLWHSNNNHFDLLVPRV